MSSAPVPSVLRHPVVTRLRSELRWHRRSVAAALAVVALAGALGDVLDRRLAPDGPTRTVLVAAHELAAGTRLEPSDLRAVRRAVDALPDRALTPTDAPHGRVVALPVRAGEIVTDVRLVGPGLLAGLGPDVVAAPVHLGDDAAVGIAQAGDLVDVLATGETGTGTTAAIGARVLVTPTSSTVVLAVGSRAATRLAAAATTSRLSIVIRGSDAG